jgi:hypothetical protein
MTPPAARAAHGSYVGGQEATVAFPPTDQLQDAPFSVEVFCLSIPLPPS